MARLDRLLVLSSMYEDAVSHKTFHFFDVSSVENKIKTKTKKTINTNRNETADNH